MKNFTQLLLFLLCFNAFAQKEANNWYFGNRAGIQFQDDGTVIPLSDSSMNTAEGCSSISDEEGNLLFYTDGRNVWDRNHVLMPNGNYNAGTGLLGDPSSTQSGIIVPKKDDPNIYYIFTVDEPHHINAAVYPNTYSGEYTEPNGAVSSTPDADDGLNNGLNYSVVDLSVVGANGSIGDIITRNVHLITYDPTNTEEAKYKCSEKITAIKNADGTGYWVITHFINKFYAFGVNATGVNATPVISQQIPVVPISGYRRNSIGCIKASPEGNKLAIAHVQIGNVTGGSSENGAVYLYDLNNATGVVSNPLQIRNNAPAYGVEFSPSGNKLYISYDNIGLHQYNMLSNNIPASDIIVANTSQSGTLQLGPNGKIYRAVVSTSFLDVIESPEEDGAACNVVLNGISLALGTSCVFGLPPFITSIFSASITATNTCLGEATEFVLNVNDTFDTISWDFGDGSPASTSVSPVHTYANPGNYNVVATITRQTNTFTFSKQITINTLPIANPIGNVSMCDPENDNKEVFVLGLNNAAILGAQNAANFDILYFASQADADAGTPSLPSGGYSNISDPQIIYARIQHKNNPECYATTSFEIKTLPTPDIDLDDVGLVCINTAEYITITAGTTSTAYTYLWFNGATTPSTKVNVPGAYTVKVTNNVGCSKIRTVTVTGSDVAIINSVDIVDLTDNNTVTVNVTPTGNVNTTYLYSIDLPEGPWQQSNRFEHVTSGMHTVYVYDINGCGVVSKDISLLEIPKFFTPNGDGTNDYWDIIGMNPLFYRNSTIQIFDRYGKLLSNVDPRGKGWDGNYNGRPLPSTDYWYVIQLEDGRTVKGHFSMIR